MLSQEQLQRMIAAEFLRVGASQQSWDQNFPTKPSIWVPDESGRPTLDPTYREEMEAFAASGGIGSTTVDGSSLQCPPGTVKEYVNGRWQCTAVGGREADPEGELYEGIGNPTNTTESSQPSGLPRFVGGRLGRVLFTPIPNRNINGIRMGHLPRVVMGAEAPGSYGLFPGVVAAAGGGTDVVQP